MTTQHDRDRSDHGDDDDDDEYNVPLSQQRVFGSGIRRKPIDFVPASDTNASILASTTTAAKPTNVGARYLSIVMGKDESSVNNELENKQNDINPSGSEPSNNNNTCAVCNQPLLTTHNSQDKTTLNAHESSIAHQVCLEHSYQPSNIDRDRVGVKYLTAYGWDVDGRKGLGASAEGIRFPIKVKEKNDTVGLRESVDPDDDDEQQSRRKKKKRHVKNEQEKIVRLNAKKIRKMDIEAKKRAEKIRQSFYGPDLEEYLGPNS
ncbi:hypothetical protein PV10_04717 [Exophiala mesophila]|uniref:G-patch domain-containing protein n=1 Tax=Exophiala mesophila TaxID=212818 RepID=A0A0D1XZ77_EXOME|nr:uncharacterized protein PV10_04717 [Exophiala mesophila]KIV93506.1 hypothetical protein PV10_04717 [Exophiala mesophila]